MKRPENVILRGETRLFLSILLVIILSAFAAANAFAAPFAYITNQNSNTFSVIDTATNAVVATIPVGSGPHSVAVNPSGTRVYVGHVSNTVSVIDTITNAVVTTIPVGSVPQGVAVNPSGTRLYVANWGSGNISVIDTATNTVVATIPVGSGPTGVAVNPSGTRLYVTNWGSTTVSVIDTSTNTVIATISVGSAPLGVVVNPSGTRLYVGNYGSNNVSVIDTSTNAVVATIPVGSVPVGVAVNPTDTRLYVANNSSNTVSVIDTNTNTVITTIPVGSGPVAFGKFIGPGAQCVEPPSGLVSWWPGEGNGDDIVGGNDGTLQGGVTFVPGMVGQAFKFDTSPNSYIALPNSPDFMPASNQVTISAWIKPDFAVANGADIIFSKRDGCGFNRSYGLAVSKAGAIPLGYPLGTIVWSASVAGNDVTPSTTVPNDGQFHHIAGTYDGTVMRVYMDGVLIGEKPHTGPIPVTSDPPFIGLQSCGSWLSAAVIDEIEFRNRALSAQEIQAIFNAGSAGECKRAAPNSAPVANAGADQTVYVGNTVTLDGSGSTDVDGDLLTYSWAFTTKPTESTAILSGTTTMNPTFTADEEGTYVVSLIVNDGTVSSSPDTVTITANEAPEEEIEVEVSIKPETINLKSKGKFKAFIELPEPYSADEVVLATVVCEGAHAIDGRVDGEDRYIATFNTQDLRITVSSKEEEVTLTVSGELEDGTKFTGSDTVKVKGKDKDR